MKRKYKNIIVPYVTYPAESLDIEIIYNDKIYTKLYEVLKDL